MGLFDIFSDPNFGPSLNSNQQAVDAARQASGKGVADIWKGVGKAQPYLTESEANFQGLQDQEQIGRTMYMNSLGLNGQGGYDAAVGAYQHTPGYDFALNEANQNVLRNQAALGGVASGQTMMDLSERARQLQNLDFGKWQDRLMGFDPMRPATARGGVLADNSNLYEQAGVNSANTRLNGAQIQAQALQNLGNVQQQAAMPYGSAQMWNAILGVGDMAAKAATGGFGA